jgi:hypothetical protein
MGSTVVTTRSGRTMTVSAGLDSALAEYPDDGEFAWALITAQANRGDMDRAAASYRQLRPALINPRHVSLWLDLLGRRPVTDADVEAALDAAGQWPGTEQARRLIEGTAEQLFCLPHAAARPETAADPVRPAPAA